MTNETPKEAARRLAKKPLSEGYKAEGLFEYSNPTFWIIRLKHPKTGEKWIRPMHFDGVEFILAEPPFPNGRPLYFPQFSAMKADNPVILTEGELKVCGLKKRLVPAATFGASDNVRRTNFQSLAGRNIKLWPDNDKPGFSCMKEAALILIALKCQVCSIDVSKLSLPPKGDCVDWLKANPGVTAKDIQNLPTIPISAMLPNSGTESTGPANQTKSPVSIDVSWEAPVPFDDKPLPVWPAGVFPAAIEDFVNEVSKSTETPTELAAGMALAVLATANQGKYQVQVKQGYCEPMNLWVCVALPPATRKTAVFQALQKPLVDWESSQRAAKKEEITTAESKRKNAEAIIAGLRRKLGYSKDPIARVQLSEEIQQAEKNIPIVPIIPQLFAQDITPENLGLIMVENNQRLSILCDEGGIFDLIAGRYSKNGIPNLDIFLQAHAGSPVRVNRTTRHKEPVIMDRPALTMGITPQPDVLRSIDKFKDLRGRGLLARFLYLVPSSNFMGHRSLDTAPVCGATALYYRDMITAILNQRSCPEDGCLTLRLSGDAYKDWLAAARRIETQLKEESGTFACIQDWAGKLPGAIARTAGQLHVARYAYSNPWEYAISPEDIGAATKIGEVLASHALKAFDLMKADPTMQSAQRVLNWLQKHPQQQFSMRECHYALKKRFSKVEELEAALKILEDRNYIQPSLQAAGRTAGRPSKLYLVHPQIWATKTTEPAN